MARSSPPRPSRSLPSLAAPIACVLMGALAAIGWLAPLPISPPPAEQSIEQAIAQGERAWERRSGGVDRPPVWIEQRGPGEGPEWTGLTDRFLDVAVIPEPPAVTKTEPDEDEDPDPDPEPKPDPTPLVIDLPWNFIGYVTTPTGQSRAVLSINGQQRVVTVGSVVRDRSWPDGLSSRVTSITPDEVMLESQEGQAQRVTRTVRESETLEAFRQGENNS